jgi:hypothetical protein
MFYLMDSHKTKSEELCPLKDQNLLNDLKQVTTVTTKEIQTNIFKRESVKDFLRERVEKTKYSIMQKKFRTAIESLNFSP